MSILGTSARMERIRPSATIMVTMKAMELRAAGRDIVSLSAGEPDFDTPAHIRDAAITAIEDGQTRYTAVDGTPELKQAIIDKFRRDNALEFEADQVIASNGAKQSLYNLMVATLNRDDEVIVRLENYGGSVHEHGFAASQLVRIRERGIPLSVCVDKVAASGGYLMACVASRIYAAPFAILGSIGVLAQIPNFNRMLDEHGVDFEQITAGKYKRTATMFGKNTDEDRAKLKEELEAGGCNIPFPQREVHLRQSASSDGD